MQKRWIPFLLLGLVLLVGCQNPTPTTPTLPARTPTPSPIPATPTPTRTSIPPTPTQPPLALSINGEGISLAEYEAEILRMQASFKETGKTLSKEEQKQRVVDSLVEQTLLAQSAYRTGFTLDESTLQKRLDDLAASLGGLQGLADWQKRNFYTDAMLRSALKRSIAAAAMRDTIIGGVPKEMEQVHARQILLQDAATAERIFKQLEAGANFATLAFNIDPETGGDLGWFPRGYLFLPEVEKAAFELPAGKFTTVIKSAYGYHIVFVIEHHQSRPLSVNAMRAMQQLALQAWLKDAREKSQVKLLV